MAQCDQNLLEKKKKNDYNITYYEAEFHFTG